MIYQRSHVPLNDAISLSFIIAFNTVSVTQLLLALELSRKRFSTVAIVFLFFLRFISTDSLGLEEKHSFSITSIT